MELIRYLQADVVSQRVAYFINSNIQHDLGMRRSESLEKLGGSIEDVLRSSYSESAFGHIRGYELDFEHCAQHIREVLQLLLGARVRHIEGAQAHAVIEAMVLGG